MTARWRDLRGPYHGLAVCAAAGMLLLLRGADNGFRDDDFVFLQHVARHRSLSDLLAPSPAFAFYRPGAILLFALESRCFGANAAGFLGFNIVLHLMNASLLVSVLQRLGLSRRVAIWSGTLFALGVGHYGKEVLWACTSGGLMAVTSILVALRGSLASSTRRGLLLVSMGILLAPLLHEIGLVAPVLVVAGLATRPGFRRSLRFVPLLFLPAVVWVALLRTMSASHPAYELGPNLVRAPWMILKYLGFMAVPLQDSQIGVAPWMRAAASLALLASSVWAWRRGSAASRLLAAWPYVVLAPFALVPMPDGWFEMRYLYLAAVPYCVLLAMLTTGALHRTAGAIRMVIATAVVCTLVLEWEMERRWDVLGHAWSGSFEQEGASSRAGKRHAQDSSFEITRGSEPGAVELAASGRVDRHFDRDRYVTLVGHQDQHPLRRLPGPGLHAGR